MFKRNYSLHKRINEALRIMEKYPNRAPIIVERSSNATSVIKY